jgi:hypothetical protein
LTIIVDANLLIYAYNAAAPQHDAAREWLERRLRATTRIGLPWQSLLAFLRITTHPRLFPQATETSNARRQVEVWLSSDAAWIPRPTERHLAIFSSLLDLPGVRGGLVHDADLAALAIEHGLTLCSADRDFAHFPGLRWENPIGA